MSGWSTLCQKLQFQPYWESVPLKQFDLSPPKNVRALAPFRIASYAMYRSCWYVGRMDSPVVLSKLPFAQIWRVVHTGPSGVTDANDLVQLPTLCRFGCGCASVTG